MQKEYDMKSSKLIGDMTTYNELKLGSDLSIFSNHHANEVLNIEFQMREIEITEGIHTCKCGSKKVYVVGEQRRSGDEGLSFFAKCIKSDCGRVWAV